jgi:hypothetical protein
MHSLGSLGLKRLLVAALFAAGSMGIATAGCAPGTSGGGTAGATGTAATSGTGTAGTTGAAGNTGAGAAGTTGSAGNTSAGAAGSAVTGSAGSAAGSTGTGSAGTTGSGGATTNTDPATFAYLYANGVEGWVLNNYADGGRANLADPARNASPAPTITHDATVGNPDAGSLKVTAHFTDWKQYVDAIINVSPRKMLTGRVLRARVRLTSGSFTGGAQIHAGTGDSYEFAAGTWTTMTVGQWIELAIDLDAMKAADTMPPTFDPSMVVQIGVKFDTGGDGGTAAFGSPIDAVFQIDTVADGVVGGALPPVVNYTFDADTQAFKLNDYDNSERKNLAGPNSPTTPALTWDGAVGSPSPGSLQASVTFSDFKQYIDAALNLSSVDLTGKVLHAWVKLDAGLFAGGVQLHAGAGPSYTYAASEFTTFAALDTWVELTLDLSAAQTAATAMGKSFPANDIRQIGVQFDTGDPYEGGTFSGPTDTLLHIDSITAQ